MHRFFSSFLIIGILFSVGCGNSEPTQKREQTKVVKPKKQSAMKEASMLKGMKPPTLEDVGNPDEVAVLTTTKGEIVLEFYPDIAPLHVANFKILSKAGFYDGTYFHRVLPGFVIQGGDPNTKDDNPRNDGMGGPPWNVEAEFNAKKHDKGILSMARSADPNSAGSQFFICLSRNQTRALDNQYTVFGNVIKGIEVVDKIAEFRRDPANPDDRTKPAVTIERARIVKRSELGL
jgi:peptidyl-prolyl cis-trans isomerase B (cyclophilin B)